MIYYYARALTARRGAGCPANAARRYAAVCPGGLVAWQPAPLARPAPYYLAGRGTQQFGAPSRGSAWAIGGNRRRLATGAFCAQRLRRATELAGAECAFLRVIARQGFQASMG